jgi:hypothetical protein
VVALAKSSSSIQIEGCIKKNFLQQVLVDPVPRADLSVRPLPFNSGGPSMAMRPGNSRRLGHHVAKPVAVNFFMGDGTTQPDLPVSHPDYLPIAAPWPGFDVNLLPYPDRIRAQDQDGVPGGAALTLTRGIIWTTGHLGHFL